MFDNLSQGQIQIHLAFTEQFQVAAASWRGFGLEPVGKFQFDQPSFEPHSSHWRGRGCDLDALAG